MEFLYLLEGLRTPVVDRIMLLVTQLGEETAFLVVALILFWCVDKRSGYYLLSVGFLGTLGNQFLKLTCRIPRPWVRDSAFTIVEQAREAASGYSFPSGHTQSAVGTFGVLAYTANRLWVRILALIIAILVPFSRLYLGVHTPLDVLVAAFIAIVLIILLKPVVMKDTGKHIPKLLIIMTLIAVGFLCYVEFHQFPGDIDAHNLASGIKNAYTLLGALAGFLVVYFLDRHFINFDVNACWWAQLLKITGGLLLVLAVKGGLKNPMNAILGESVGRAVRYFLIVIAAGCVWPLTFRWFSRLGKAKHNMHK